MSELGELPKALSQIDSSLLMKLQEFSQNGKRSASSLNLRPAMLSIPRVSHPGIAEVPTISPSVFASARTPSISAGIVDDVIDQGAVPLSGQYDELIVPTLRPLAVTASKSRHRRLEDDDDGIVPDSDDDGKVVRSKKWTKKERNMLIDALRGITARVLADTGLGDVDVDAATVPFEQIDACVDEIDFDKLAAAYFPGKSGAECRAEWRFLSARAEVGTHLQGKGKWGKDEDQRLVEGIRDYGDSHWKAVATYVGTRTAAQCLHRWKHSLKPTISRAKWNPTEDARLLAAVRKHGRHWSVIAHVMGNRTGAQCRERYCNKLDPDIYRGAWTAEEDERLEQAVAEIGAGKWAQIAKLLTPPRTDYQIRKRWYIISRMHEQAEQQQALEVQQQQKQQQQQQEQQQAQYVQQMQHSQSGLAPLSARDHVSLLLARQRMMAQRTLAAATTVPQPQQSVYNVHL